MHKHPVPQIDGTAPRVATRKNQLPQKQTTEVQELSAEYLRIRNVGQLAKAQQHQMQLAKERGELIPKNLVKLQASYLLISLRQRILAVPDKLCRQLAEEADPFKVRQILKTAMLTLLQEIENLPNCVEKDWLAKAEE